MDVERGFFGGFSVLGVTMFVAGFLFGMLFLGAAHVSPDAITLGLISFALGLTTGILTIALVLIAIKKRVRESRRTVWWDHHMTEKEKRRNKNIPLAEIVR
jgi:membrane-bound ClpP family serine protease